MKRGLHLTLTALLLGAFATVSHHPGDVKVAGGGDEVLEAWGTLSAVPVQQIRWRWPLAGSACGVPLHGTERDEGLSMPAGRIRDTTEDSPPVAKALSGQVFQDPSYRF